MKVLVVTSAFGGHTRGSKITDPAEIEKVLAGENAHHVTPSDHDDGESPQVTAEVKPTSRKATESSK
jgi:hypothetical protein